MVKDSETVIRQTKRGTILGELSKLVNMIADDLEDWLETKASAGSRWAKDDGPGESIGHDSGRRIVEILRKNPVMDENGYDEGDIRHMRKVVSYCKRHLAQEATAQKNMDSKSYKSLKNWGHNVLKK